MLYWQPAHLLVDMDWLLKAHSVSLLLPDQAALVYWRFQLAQHCSPGVGAVVLPPVSPGVPDVASMTSVVPGILEKARRNPLQTPLVQTPPVQPILGSEHALNVLGVRLHLAVCCFCCCLCMQDVNITNNLLKAKKRAVEENVAYMEIMLRGPPV